MSALTTEPALVEVKILRLPLDLYQETSEHQDELRREFALVLRGDPETTGGAPAHLEALVDKLEARFASFTAEPTAELREALASGEEEIDLVCRVPLQAREAVIALDAVLDEADDFCRRGNLLLTLTTPPRALAFRKWFLGEFVAQIDGAPPTPWTQAKV